MSIFERAVVSVHGRGLPTAVPPLHFHNTRLMMQMVRLVEEIGEWHESEHEINELADIVIVCAQVAWLLGVQINEAVFEAPGAFSEDANLAEMAGMLARSLRKNDGTMMAMSLACLVGDCVALAQAQGCPDLRPVIEAKLAADEKRGFSHGSPRAN